MLPVEVLVRRQDLVVVPGPVRASGKRFLLSDGSQLRLTHVSRRGRWLTVGVELTSSAAVPFDRERHVFELVVQGRRRRPYFEGGLFRTGSRPAWGPEGLLLAGGPPGGGLPGALPWAGLALNPPAGRTVWAGSLQFETGEATAGLKLALVHFERRRTELPFEFRDLPLP